MNEDDETLTLFAVNKDLEDSMELTCDLRQFSGYQVKEHIILNHSDLKAVNTEENPDNVAPVKIENAKLESGILNTVLSEHSFHVIRLGKY